MRRLNATRLEGGSSPLTSRPMRCAQRSSLPPDEDAALERTHGRDTSRSRAIRDFDRGSNYVSSRWGLPMAWKGSGVQFPSAPRKPYDAGFPRSNWDSLPSRHNEDSPGGSTGRGSRRTSRRSGGAAPGSLESATERLLRVIADSTRHRGDGEICCQQEILSEVHPPLGQVADR
jgi:hypothetical protein